VVNVGNDGDVSEIGALLQGHEGFSWILDSYKGTEVRNDGGTELRNDGMTE
jgi:hypothetical protein